MTTITQTIELGGTVRTKRVQCDDPDTPGTLPRITRLMAIAIRFDELLRSGEATGLRHLAAVGRVSQPRVSQILNLTLLAPDIQEHLLFLPRIDRGKPEISEKSLRPITAIVDWDEQRKSWKNAGFGDLSRKD